MALASSQADATTTFNYTGGYQQFTAPTTGTYTIDAFGAQGGDFGSGDGAGVGGNFVLSAGEVLDVFVGAAGSYGFYGGGGGGGSFVAHAGSALLVAGGGGGGVGGFYYGDAGQQGTSGSNGHGVFGGAGGQNGAAGGAGGYYGGGGRGGAGFSGGALGGAGATAYYGGGGGGGISGGGGGFGAAGGGGGSFFGGIGSQVDLGTNTGNGLVSIDAAAATAVPEPLSWAMMIAGFGVIGWLRREQLRRGSPPEFRRPWGGPLAPTSSSCSGASLACG